jgi:hypothetical protein
MLSFIQLCYVVVSGADYGRTVQMITFPAGQLNVSIFVSIVDDLIDEQQNETFMASLSSPSSGLSLGDRNLVVITIIDNDGKLLHVIEPILFPPLPIIPPLLSPQFRCCCRIWWH